MIVKIHIAIELLEKGRMLTKEIHKCIYGWAILAQNMPLGTRSIMEGEKNNLVPIWSPFHSKMGPH